MSRYSYSPLEGMGKQPVRSAVAQSLREMGLIPRAAVGGKRRVERKGGKASASAGGRHRRTGNKVED